MMSKIVLCGQKLRENRDFEIGKWLLGCRSRISWKIQYSLHKNSFSNIDIGRCFIDFSFTWSFARVTRVYAPNGIHFRSEIPCILEMRTPLWCSVSWKIWKCSMEYLFLACSFQRIKWNRILHEREECMLFVLFTELNWLKAFPK